MYTVITRNNCVHCDRAKALLRDQGISFVSYNVESRSSKWILSLLRMAEIKTVPQIFDSDGTHVGGFSDLVPSLGLDHKYH